MVQITQSDMITNRRVFSLLVTRQFLEHTKGWYWHMYAMTLFPPGMKMGVDPPEISPSIPSLSYLSWQVKDLIVLCDDSPIFQKGMFYLLQEREWIKLTKTASLCIKNRRAPQREMWILSKWEKYLIWSKRIKYFSSTFRVQFSGILSFSQIQVMTLSHISQRTQMESGMKASVSPLS